MATHSFIGILNEDNTVTNIYCNYDGFLHEVGKTLLEHYQDENKVRELMKLGDISSLGANISTELVHTYLKPVEGVTVAYMRDSKFENAKAAKTVKLEKYLKLYHDYHYLYKEGKWFYIAHFNETLTELTETEINLAKENNL